jgi:hypothetical protein
MSDTGTAQWYTSGGVGATQLGSLVTVQVSYQVDGAPDMVSDGAKWSFRPAVVDVTVTRRSRGEPMLSSARVHGPPVNPRREATLEPGQRIWVGAGIDDMPAWLAHLVGITAARTRS